MGLFAADLGEVFQKSAAEGSGKPAAKVLGREVEMLCGVLQGDGLPGDVFHPQRHLLLPVFGENLSRKLVEQGEQQAAAVLLKGK